MDRIAVMDMDSIAYAIASPNKIPKGDDFERDEKGRLLYIDKTEEEIIINAEHVMSNILQSCLADNYIGFIKGKNTGKYRYAIKSDYKHNRSKEKPSWWDFTSKLLTEKYNVFLVDDYEVDDIVNIYRLLTKNSFMVACDKDLLHLTGVHFNWKTDKWHANTEEEASRMFWTDMITGQSGDGIKGIPSKGVVYANSVLNNLDIKELPYKVLEEYQSHMKNGISEFSKNYSCLKILDLNDKIDLDLSKYTAIAVNKGGKNEI